MRRPWLCLLLLAACATPSPGPAAPGRPSVPRTLPRPAPAWRFQPLSWAKLEAVETWLDREGRRAPAEERIEAELALADGRLTFARRDAGRVGGASAGVRERLASAAAGYRRVLAEPRLRALESRRATRGLEEAQGLLVRPAGPATVTQVPRARWSAAPAAPARLTRNDGRWTRVTVHHSADYAGLLRGKDARESGRVVRSIQRYHMEQKGYGDIAYHYLIDPSGRVFEGRSLQWQGAHAGGSNNVHNIGICLLGDFDREAPTPAALASLASLTSSLRATFRIAASAVVGHGELKTTACPGRHLRSWLHRYRGGPGLAVAR